MASLQELAKKALQKSRTQTKPAVNPISNAAAFPSFGVGAEGSSSAYYEDKDPRAKDFNRALDLTNVETLPAQRQHQRNLDMLRNQLGRDIDVQNYFGDLYDRRLQDIEGDLIGRLQGTNANIAQLYSQGRRGVSDAYADSIAGMLQGADTVAGGLEGSASQLGVEEALRDPLAKLQADLARMTGESNQSRAGALGNLIGLGTHIQALGQQAVGDTSREYAQNRSNLLNEVLGNIAQSQREYGERSYEELGGLSDIAATQGARMRGILADLEDQRYNRGFEREQFDWEKGVTQQELDRQRSLDELAREIQKRTMALQERQFERGTFESDRDYQLQLDQLGLQARALEAELNATEDPTEAAIKQAQLEKLLAQIDQIRTKTGQITNASGFPSGMAGLEQFYSQPSRWWSGGAGPKFKSTVANIIKAATDQVAKEAQLGSGKAATDPYIAALRFVDAGPGSQFAPPSYINRDALRLALQIFFQGVK